MEKMHSEVCNICDKTFGEVWKIDLHYKNAHNMSIEEGKKVLRKVQCFVCPNILQENALCDHVKSNHSGLYAFFKTMFNDDKELCENCGKFFKFRIMKEKHMKTCK